MIECENIYANQVLLLLSTAKALMSHANPIEAPSYSNQWNPPPFFYFIRAHTLPENLHRITRPLGRRISTKTSVDIFSEFHDPWFDFERLKRPSFRFLEIINIWLPPFSCSLPAFDETEEDAVKTVEDDDVAAFLVTPLDVGGLLGDTQPEDTDLEVQAGLSVSHGMMVSYFLGALRCDWRMLTNHRSPLDLPEFRQLRSSPYTTF
jgi:hypothetical protein